MNSSTHLINCHKNSILYFYHQKLQLNFFKLIGRFLKLISSKFLVLILCVIESEKFRCSFKVGSFMIKLNFKYYFVYVELLI
jgi:hypothetical protein